MSLSADEYLRHISDEIAYLIKHAQGIDQRKFFQDATLQRAFVRSLEIIGEATKNIPDELKQKYSQIDWRAIAGMRDKLVHHYFGVDYELVWDIVINEIPALRKQIKQILER